jgi:hypothetical protein
MEAGKVIGNVIIFGGIGAIGYLLFKKKPVIQQVALTKTLINGVEKSEYEKNKAKLCADAIGKGNWSRKDFIKDCVSLQERSELTEPLLDQSALQIKADYNTWDATTRDYYTPTGDIKANTCLELDFFIKTLEINLVNLYELAGAGLKTYKPIIAVTEKAKADAIAKFNKFNCRDKIEALRTRTLVDLQSKGSIKAEESVLGKGFVEQKGYIILGALVLLTGFYAIVKK